jgi:hypothetical protein
MGTFVSPIRIPSTQIVRRERPSWLTIAAAAISSGKTPAAAIGVADAFEQLLWEDYLACPTIEDQPPSDSLTYDYHPNPPASEASQELIAAQDELIAAQDELIAAQDELIAAQDELNDGEEHDA